MKRNKISRLLAVSMSVCLLAAGVTGCSSSQEDSADQTAEENTSETEGEETEILWQRQPAWSTPMRRS